MKQISHHIIWYYILSFESLDKILYCFIWNIHVIITVTWFKGLDHIEWWPAPGYEVWSDSWNQVTIMVIKLLYTFHQTEEATKLSVFNFTLFAFWTNYLKRTLLKRAKYRSYFLCTTSSVSVVISIRKTKMWWSERFDHT